MTEDSLFENGFDPGWDELTAAIALLTIAQARLSDNPAFRDDEVIQSLSRANHLIKVALSKVQEGGI